jgi:hypothetical protein
MNKFPTLLAFNLAIWSLYNTDMLAKLKANKANSTVIPIQFDGVDSHHNEKKEETFGSPSRQMLYH